MGNAMKADHVVMNTVTSAFECKHCGKTYQPTIPAPITVFASMAKEFSKIHKNCKLTTVKEVKNEQN
jgi:rubredoxin